MFKDTKTFSSFSTDDLKRAKEFYGTTLGIETKDNEMGVLELHLGQGAMGMIYPKPDHKPATFTVLNFLVDDVEKAVDKLVAKGVTFEHYDMGEGMKTDEKGIMKNPDGGSIAWFKDPAGNILSLISEKK
ncbi:MAG TPA: VOC family protein [Patescibacteria group bacterium]|nr:VOC family protein [Patescibacteria group bacterium]